MEIATPQKSMFYDGMAQCFHSKSEGTQRTKDLLRFIIVNIFSWRTKS